MGRWIVILLSSLLTIGALVFYLPGLRQTAFPLLGAGIPWAALVGCGVVYTFHRMVGKK